GEISADYPQTSPAGRQLLGTASAVLWDAKATRTGHVQRGNRVSYRTVSYLPAADDAGYIARDSPCHVSRTHVLDAGVSTATHDNLLSEKASVAWSYAL